MKKFYTNEKNVQIVIALMKEHGIKKIVASPGATNVTFIGSIQSDPYFEIYSCVDERSAAYMACGLAAESGEPVALTCTGATASRNYISALTEAFYRKLPVIAITSTQHTGRIGQNIPQVIDRTIQLNDIVKKSVQVPLIYSEEDKWACEIKVNTAFLELTHHNGGPVHINLETNYSLDFSVKELPKVKVIKRIGYNEEFPKLNYKRIGIFVGAHKKWKENLITAIDEFCKKYNAVVFTDHSSNYKGKYNINASLICSQQGYIAECKKFDLLIHIGDISGAYMNISPKEVWRVNPDGIVRDTFKKLSFVFEMKEEDFFKECIKVADNYQMENSYLVECKKEYNELLNKVPELPFSNVWIAQQSVKYLPKNSVLHFGILNTLRAWNFFEIPESVFGYCNTGGFGIDGILSSLIGASLSDKNKLFFGVLGDLAFFYDMNVIGNHHVSNNLRIMLINNGRGTEFRNYNHPASYFKEEADKYMAAAGHFGNKSLTLIKHYAEDLGFEYISAKNKNEFLEKRDYFFKVEMTDKPIIFEIFTDSEDESNAIEIMYNLKTSTKGIIKNIVKEIASPSQIELLKKAIKKR